MRDEIKKLIELGLYDQHDIFKILYPIYKGHYSALRDLISEVKNDDANTKR